MKAPNNPIGARAVIAELVAAELATWYGLKVPDFAVIPTCNIDLMMTNGQMMEGPLFFSSEVIGTPRDGTDVLLSRLRDRDDISKLVVFDTWVLNWDRHGLADTNSENLLYVRNGRKFDLVPIDHAWAFDRPSASDLGFPLQPPHVNDIEDTVVYGYFPEFAPYIDHRSVSRALDHLAKLDRKAVVEIVNSVPAEWKLGPKAADSLVELICRRAAFVVNTIAARLVDDPPIPGLCHA